MTKHLISGGSEIGELFSRISAVICDAWAFVAGTTGMNYAKMTIADGVAAQYRQALETIRAALSAACEGIADVDRINHILPDAADIAGCEPAMKIEIEVMARLPAEPLDLGAREA